MSTGLGALDAPWAVLQGRRLGWAYRAYHRFIETLSPEVAEHLVQGKGGHAPYVVVFGKSQVGKTTLLLELMGVTAQALKEVGEVLRGGREYGKSATATTMEYRRSPDACWHLDSGAAGEVARRYATGTAMSAALADLRQAMRERRLKADAPAVVWIPDQYFGAVSRDRIDTRMLDLPGDNPVDLAERDHVRRMAERYVPYADLILLVGRAAGLTFLFPEQLALPGIEDWQLVPNRFRIVTTYSFTPDSVQRHLRAIKKTLEPRHVRERLLEQIATYGRAFTPEARDSKRYYPLEFGDSWRRQAEADQAFVQRLEPVLASLRAELRADIASSASEEARFRNAYDVHVIARRKLEEYRRSTEKELGAIGDRIADVRDTAAQAAEASLAVEKRANKLATLVAQRQHAEQQLASAFVIDITQWNNDLDHLKETTTGALLVHINEVSAELQQCFLELHPTGPDRAALLGNLRLDLNAAMPQVKRVVDACFGSVVAHLNDYSADEYYPSVFSSFSKDKAALRHATGLAADAITKLARALWREQLAQRVHELTADAARARAEQAVLDTVVAQKGADEARLVDRHTRVQSEFAEITARLERDAAASERYKAMLQLEYLDELRARSACIANARTGAESLLALLSVQALIDERRKIIPF